MWRSRRLWQMTLWSGTTVGSTCIYLSHYLFTQSWISLLLLFWTHMKPLRSVHSNVWILYNIYAGIFILIKVLKKIILNVNTSAGITKHEEFDMMFVLGVLWKGISKEWAFWVHWPVRGLSRLGVIPRGGSNLFLWCCFPPLLFLL